MKPAQEISIVAQTPPRVLLVEDNDIIATIESSFLHNLNCYVDIANDAQAALNYAKLNVYDLILLDIGLPDISGIVLANILQFHLKKECPPMIAITTLSDNETMSACINSGIKQLFVKPVNFETFKNILSAYLPSCARSRVF